MKHTINIVISAIIIITSVFVVLAASSTRTALAETEDATNTTTICDPETDSSCADPAVEECGKSGSGDCGLFEKYINPIIVFLSAMVGIAVTIGIVSGGIQYAAAGSDPGAVAKARAKIRNSIFALVAFLFLFALVNWLVPGGLVGRTSTNPAKSPSNSSVGKTPATPPLSTPSPAVTALNGVENFRDAGASGFIKTGILYRSAKLQTAVPSQISALLGSGTIIDLRTPSVIAKSPDVSVSGVRAVNTPINGTEDYTEFVTSSASRQGFKNAITAIANANGKVLIHCTYGKDRTGWTVAMIMYALGASDSQVMTEYLKSPDVSRDMLNAGLSQVRKDYGSIENYLYEGIGLTSQTVDKLEQKLR